MKSFEEKHSDLFFGRKALTEKLSQFVCQHPLTVVLGASGTGKSSLVKAGLIPYLKEKNQWRIVSPMRPGEFPLKALNKIFNKLLSQQALSDFSIINPTVEQKADSLSDKIAEIVALNPQSKLLLVVDQTEELLTICRDERERDSFLNLLARWLAKYPQQLRIVLTLRSDFEPQLRNLALESSWQKSRFIVPAMTRDELRQAIEEPASARVMYFEPHSLVEQLIDEVAQMPGALPLLSFALSELYLKYLRKFREGKRDKRAITQQDYQEIGGVVQSLTQRADSEYEELIKQEQAYAQTIRHVMLRMIAVGGGELARRRVLLSELEYPEPENERVKEVIRRFSTVRLLVEGQDADGNPYVEPAHDALVRGWGKIKYWLGEKQEVVEPVSWWNPIKEWLNANLEKVPLPLALKENISKGDRSNSAKQLKVNLSLQREVTAAAFRWYDKKKETQFLWNANPYLMVRGCDWMRDYLKNNPEAESYSHLCEGIGTQKR